MSPEVSTFLIGLFGGAGATLVWELFLRPLRERRAIAEVLSAEVSLNIQLLATARHYASPNKIPPDFSLSTSILDNLIAQIGALPPTLVGQVVILYSYFKELNQQPSVYAESVKELRTHAPGSSNYKQVEGELRACVDVFNSYIEGSLERVNSVQPHLLKAAYPWWSLRRWTRKPSVSLDMDELAQQIAQSVAKRKALAAEIARRDQERRRND